MPRLSIIVAALVAFAPPAQADETPATIAWSVFSEHCTKFLTANSLAEINAAFDPHETKIFSTVDGAIQTATAEIEKIGIAGMRVGYFQTSTTRLDGGSMRTCALQLIGEGDTSISGLAALVQEKASDILGAGHSIQGGPVVTTEGSEGASLFLAMPDFPPEKSIQLLSTPRFSSITVHTMTAE